MKKASIVIAFLLITIVNGCSKDSKLIKLENKYYGETEFLKLSSNEVNKIINDQESFILFTYNNYCSMSVPCDKIFEEFVQNESVQIVSIPFEELTETSLHDTIKYAPSVIIIDKGEIVKYLDAESDEDLVRYQDVKEFTKWVSKYVEI